MAQFDVFEATNGALVVDCQAEFLREISTRFVLPLISPGDAPPPNPRINPTFDIDGERLILVSQFATSLLRSELRRKVGSLAGESLRVTNAIDALIGAG